MSDMIDASSLRAHTSWTALYSVAHSRIIHCWRIFFFPKLVVLWQIFEDKELVALFFHTTLFARRVRATMTLAIFFYLPVDIKIF